MPTGSQDPYALRRQAIGLVRLIDERKLRLSVGALVRAGAAGYAIDDPESSGVVAQILAFIRQRARNAGR